MSPAPEHSTVAVITPLPLSVAFGGRELQALRTIAALRSLGVAVEPLAHWETQRRYGLLHAFGTEGGLWETASRSRGAGVRVIVSPVLVFGRRMAASRAWAKFDRLVPMRTSFRFRRDLLRLADAVVALTASERRVLTDVFDVDPQRCHVVPNGVDDIFRDATPHSYRKRWGDTRFVLCVGSIETRKRQLDVLRAARVAGRAVVFIGDLRPDDAYGATFAEAVRGAHDVVWHQKLPAASELLASAYAAADATVLVSSEEGMPLSALEARAAGCPLILSDLPQHVEAFPGATFVPVGDAGSLAAAIAGSAGGGDHGAHHPKPWSWAEVAQALRRVYATVAPEMVSAE